jgi:hypothetical protein
LRRRRNLFGLAPPALVLSSSTTCAVFRAPPSFRSYLFHGTSSLELLLLFRVPFCITCPSSADVERLPWGLFLLRDFSVKSPLSSRFPSLPTFRPQRFSRSRRLTPLPTLRHIFIRYHVRDFSTGVFPGNQSTGLSPVRTLLSLAPLFNASPSGFCSDYQSVARACSVGSLQSARSPLEFMLPWVLLRTS